jgi:gas vesicle protein
MTKGGAAGFGAGFFLTFGIAKLAGASTGNSLLAGLVVGVALGGSFELIVAPTIRAKISSEQAKAEHAAIKNMNQAQADAFAQRIFNISKGNYSAASDVFDKQKMIDALALANYTYKDGKAIKNK